VDYLRVSHLPNRSVISRRASREFISEAELRSPPRRRLSRRSTPGHDFCPPFRPSARSRGGSGSRLPRLSALGCLTSFACAGPTMPSADDNGPGCVRRDVTTQAHPRPLTSRGAAACDVPWNGNQRFHLHILSLGNKDTRGFSMLVCIFSADWHICLSEGLAEER
jgi:hypothetical protein